MNLTTTVRVDVDDAGVAVLTLDGADRLNAFSGETARQLGAAYRRCDADDAVRAVVLTGAGRAFCAGADMSAAAGSFDTPGDGFSASPVQPPAWRVRKLVIAAINGPAIGIGLTLALQCDVRLAARDAKLAVPQVRRGMVGDCAVHYTLRHSSLDAPNFFTNKAGVTERNIYQDHRSGGSAGGPLPPHRRRPHPGLPLADGAVLCRRLRHRRR